MTSANDYLSARNARLAELRKQIREAEESGDRRRGEVDRLRRKYEAIRTGRAIPLRA